MNLSPSAEGYSVESIPELRSYVENQGDKFHPLSDELFAVLRTDARTPVEPSEDLLDELLIILASYEAAPDSTYHLYHVGELRARLAPPVDWADED